MAKDIFAWRSRDASEPPPLLQYRSSRWFILSTICVAVFTDIFTYGIIVPVIPFALTKRAGIPAHDVQHWVSVLLGCYGAALLAASPICGWLADKSPSRRLPLLVGLLALGGATVMLCVGNSIGILIAGRLIQGFSAAIVWTVGLALLADTVGKDEIGQVVGYVSIAMSIGILIAPLLGGIVYARGGYYSVYYMVFGLILLDVLFRVTLIEKKVARQWIRHSEPKRSAIAGSLEKTPTESQSSDADTRPAGTSEPASRSSTSQLPPVITLLASPRLLASLWGCLAASGLLTAFDSVLPLRVNALFGWGSTGAGLVFLALIIPSFIAPLVGHISDRHGPRWLSFFGFLLSCPSLVLLRLVDHGGIRQVVLLCALLVLLGLTLTLVMTPLLAEITYVVEDQETKEPGKFGERGAYAQAYGLFNCAFAGGTLVGPIWAGFVESRVGWGTMSWTLGLFSAFSSIPAIIWTGGFITQRHGSMERWNNNEGKSQVDGEQTPV